MNDGYPILSWQEGADDDLGGLNGEGTEDDPYLIYTLQDLRILSEGKEYWNNVVNTEDFNHPRPLVVHEELI